MNIRQRMESGGWSRRVRWTVGGVGAALALTLGGWLIAGHLASIPPDPANDDPQAVVAYFLGPHFDTLSEAERRAYIQAMIGRYASMDPDQRERVREAVRQRRRGNGDELRERMIGMWRDFAVNEARQYVELPPAERGAWLEQRMSMWRMLGGDPERARARGDRGRAEGERLTPERQRRVVGFFQEQVLPRTSGRERALVMLLMRDIMREHGE